MPARKNLLFRFSVCGESVSRRECVLYVCPKCGKEFQDKEVEFVRCPYCNTRVLFKKTPNVVTRVKAE